MNFFCLKNNRITTIRTGMTGLVLEQYKNYLETLSKYKPNICLLRDGTC